MLNCCGSRLPSSKVLSYCRLDADPLAPAMLPGIRMYTCVFDKFLFLFTQTHVFYETSVAVTELQTSTEYAGPIQVRLWCAWSPGEWAATSAGTGCGSRMTVLHQHESCYMVLLQQNNDSRGVHVEVRWRLNMPCGRAATERLANGIRLPVPRWMCRCHHCSCPYHPCTARRLQWGMRTEKLPCWTLTVFCLMQTGKRVIELRCKLGWATPATQPGNGRLPAGLSQQVPLPATMASWHCHHH